MKKVEMKNTRPPVGDVFAESWFRPQIAQLNHRELACSFLKPNQSGILRSVAAGRERFVRPWPYLWLEPKLDTVRRNPLHTRIEDYEGPPAPISTSGRVSYLKPAEKCSLVKCDRNSCDMECSSRSTQSLYENLKDSSTRPPGSSSVTKWPHSRPTPVTSSTDCFQTFKGSDLMASANNPLCPKPLIMAR